MRAFDAIIVGAGQAGPSLAGRLSDAGKTVAIIERKHVGGTCVNTGCKPTKTLVASAYAARLAQRASDYGVQLGGPVTIDMPAVMRRAYQVTLDSRHGNERWLGSMAGCTLIRGHARFTDRTTLRVGEDFLTARRSSSTWAAVRQSRTFRVLRTSIPDQQRHGEARPRARPPRHHRRQLYRARIRADVSPLRCRGDRHRKGSPPRRPRGREDLNCHPRDPGSRGVFRGDGRGRHPLSKGGTRHRRSSGRRQGGCDGDRRPARGRPPSEHDDLGLETAGVEVDARGYIRVDDQLATTAEGIWALGDCNGKGAFTHTAYNDFEIVARPTSSMGRPERSPTAFPATRSISIRRSGGWE